MDWLLRATSGSPAHTKSAGKRLPRCVGWAYGGWVVVAVRRGDGGAVRQSCRSGLLLSLGCRGSLPVAKQTGAPEPILGQAGPGGRAIRGAVRVAGPDDGLAGHRALVCLSFVAVLVSGSGIAASFPGRGGGCQGSKIPKGREAPLIRAAATRTVKQPGGAIQSPLAAATPDPPEPFAAPAPDRVHLHRQRRASSPLARDEMGVYSMRASR
jgi:hypothetical protein